MIEICRRAVGGDFLSRVIDFGYIAGMSKLTPIESEFATEEDAAAHDAWVRAKVEKALASKAPRIPHDQVMAMARKTIDKHKPK